MLLICKACTTAFSVGAPKCPQCGGKKWCEQGSKDHLAMPAAAASDTPDGGETPDV